MSLIALPIPVEGPGPAVLSPRFQGQEPAEVEFAAMDVDVEVQHRLGRIPQGFLVIGLSEAMVVYNGSAAPTESSFTLRSSAPGTALVLFV